jgi:hypothetical protein
VAPRLLRPARVGVFAQAVALLAVVGLTVPSYLEYLTHPISCTAGELCLDFRDLPFVAATAYLGPPAFVLLTTFWLWRRPRRWPAALPILVDVAVFVMQVAYYPFVFIPDFNRPTITNPLVALQVLLMLIPAAISLTLVLALLIGWNWKDPAPGAVSSSHST